MMGLRMYMGSKSMEEYLNKKSKKGFVLDGIYTFGLFAPLRVDVFKFKKANNLTRTYRIDSRKIEKKDFDNYIQLFSDDGWKYFPNNYVNDEFNNDNIFFSDDLKKCDIFSNQESIKERNKASALSSLWKGIYLSLALLFIYVFFPEPFSNYSNNFIGFLLHNSYLIISIMIILVSVFRYHKYK